MAACWGDVGLVLSMPRQGLGNAAIASIGDDEQRARFSGVWASMAITEPECGSDSAAIRTTAVLDGDEYVLNGEKIFVTAGERSDAVVVWATLDPSRGRAAIKPFVVEKSAPGVDCRAGRTQARHPRVRHRDDPLHRRPRASGESARLARRRTPTRDSPVSCRPSTTRAHSWRRWRSASRRRRSTRASAMLDEAGIAVDYDRPPAQHARRCRVHRHGGRLGGRVPDHPRSRMAR